MIPINNSDTAWLIVSDYNQENDIGFPEALREDIVDIGYNDWLFEYSLTLALIGVGGGIGEVGDKISMQVGGGGRIGGSSLNNVGGLTLGRETSRLVGGNHVAY